MDNARRAKTFEKAVAIYGSGNPQEILIDLLTDAHALVRCQRRGFSHRTGDGLPPLHPRTQRSTTRRKETNPMNHATYTANPFYAARLKRVAPRTEERDRPVYARLPLAPRNASPVPHLTSLYHFHRAGEYGDRSYPGNCGGNLIRDLLLYFKPQGIVCDPMQGSGTCPRRLRRTWHPVHVLGHPSGIRCLRPAGICSQRDVRLHLGTPAVLATEALRRRSSRSVAGTNA